jgi:hypothetical protein
MGEKYESQWKSRHHYWTGIRAVIVRHFARQRATVVWVV